MTKFNWTPNQIDGIPIPIVEGILEKMEEEHRKMERERRLADRRAKMRR